MRVGGLDPYVAGNYEGIYCAASLRPILAGVIPTIEWVGPNGTRLENGTDLVLYPPDSPQDIYVVVFAPLHTRHGGEYRCQASVVIPQTNVSITGSSNLNVTVQSE